MKTFFFEFHGKAPRTAMWKSGMQINSYCLRGLSSRKNNVSVVSTYVVSFFFIMTLILNLTKMFMKRITYQNHF